MLVDPGDETQLDRARAASDELIGLAVELGGSVSGEHGLGWVRRGELERQWSAPALDLHEAIKRTFDPKGLLNPGKKAARLVGQGRVRSAGRRPDREAGAPAVP
jgi:glycolate oxidase